MENTYRVKDLSGFKFGKLTVIKKQGTDKFKKTEWLCKCDCGNYKIAKRDLLIKGHTKSCGCLFKEVMSDIDYSKRNSKAPEKHGMTNTRFYKIWIGIKERCRG